MSGSTLLRLGGQITGPSSLFAVWFQLHPELHEIQMRHLWKGAWFYVAQLTVYGNTLNKNINTGEETGRPLGAPDPNAGWINSTLAPLSLRWSKQDPLMATTGPRPCPLGISALLSQARIPTLCHCLTLITHSDGQPGQVNSLHPPPPKR